MKKNISKSIIKISTIIALVLIFLLVPTFLVGCGDNNKDSNGQNIQKAVGTVIETINEHNTNIQTAETLSLNFVETDESIQSNLILLEFFKECANSTKYKYSELPFKATMSVSMQSTTMELYTTQKYNVNGNNIKLEMVFTYENSFANADYECLEMNYDFDADKLISFTWTSFVNGDEDYLSCCKYEEEKIYRLIETEDDEYIALKSATKTTAENLYNAIEIFEETFDFSSEYVKVYNKYNPNNHIVKA